MKKTTVDRLNINPNALCAKQIDIWQIPLHLEPQWAFTLLSDEEKQRASRYHFARHCRRFTVTRALLRVILSQYTKQNAKHLLLDTLKHGKPYLSEYPEIQFNLSDSGEYALIAVGTHHPLGIDLEFFSQRPYLGLSQQVFSKAEQQALSALPQSLQPVAFFNAWSQKEAFIKAIGLGLSYPTKSFTVPLFPHEALEIYDNDSKRWQIHAFMPQPACSAALCCAPEVKTIAFHKVRHLEKIKPGSQ